MPDREDQQPRFDADNGSFHPHDRQRTPVNGMSVTRDTADYRAGTGSEYEERGEDISLSD
jgi:hypothetical protein